MLVGSFTAVHQFGHFDKINLKTVVYLVSETKCKKVNTDKTGL